MNNFEIFEREGARGKVKIRVTIIHNYMKKLAKCLYLFLRDRLIIQSKLVNDTLLHTIHFSFITLSLLHGTGSIRAYPDWKISPTRLLF
jgi:hypothetical protein